MLLAATYLLLGVFCLVAARWADSWRAVSCAGILTLWGLVSNAVISRFGFDGAQRILPWISAEMAVAYVAVGVATKSHLAVFCWIGCALDGLTQTTFIANHAGGGWWYFASQNLIYVALALLIGGVSVTCGLAARLDRIGFSLGAHAVGG